MKVANLVLRCYARYDEGQWVAICLDFDLAAQAETVEGAQAKLESMIKEYLFDALVGEDQAYAEQFLSRKAPLFEWLRYYFYLFRHYLIPTHQDYYLFHEPLPLTPYLHGSV